MRQGFAFCVVARSPQTAGDVGCLKLIGSSESSNILSITELSHLHISHTVQLDRTCPTCNALSSVFKDMFSQHDGGMSVSASITEMEEVRGEAECASLFPGRMFDGRGRTGSARASVDV